MNIKDLNKLLETYTNNTKTKIDNLDNFLLKVLQQIKISLYKQLEKNPQKTNQLVDEIQDKLNEFILSINHKLRSL